jgi:hypothetical protein
MPGILCAAAPLIGGFSFQPSNAWRMASGCSRISLAFSFNGWRLIARNNSIHG